MMTSAGVIASIASHGNTSVNNKQTTCLPKQLIPDENINKISSYSVLAALSTPANR